MGNPSLRVPYNKNQTNENDGVKRFRGNDFFLLAKKLCVLINMIEKIILSKT